MENTFAGNPLPETPRLQSTSFPGHRYHPSGASRLFQTAEDFDAAGPGWRDVPYPASAAAAFSGEGQPAKTAADPPACETCKKLVSENVTMKLRFDKSYGELRVRYDGLKEQHDLLASQNVVLTRELTEWQGKAQAFEAALASQPPQEATPPAPLGPGAETQPPPTPASPKAKNK